MRVGNLGFAFGLALCAWLGMLRSEAHAEALTALLRLTEPADRALEQRIRGQTGDLDVRLLEQELAPLEPGLHAQLASARALAGEARVVIWAQRSQGRLTMVVADLELDRVLVRELPAGEGERSAQEEAAALVVRGALKASLAGAPLGSAERELPPEPAIEPAPVVVEPPKSVAPAPKRELLERHLVLGLGAWAAADGVSTHGNYGLGGRAALWLGRFELGARGDLGLRSTLADAPTRVRLAQHRAELYAGYAVLAAAPVRLTLAGAVGLLDYSTHVRAQQQLAARDARGVLASVGAGALLQYFPAFARERFGLAFSAFAELFPERLSLGYRSANGFTRFDRAYRVQPLFALELVFRL